LLRLDKKMLIQNGFVGTALVKEPKPDSRIRFLNMTSNWQGCRARRSGERGIPNFNVSSSGAIGDPWDAWDHPSKIVCWPLHSESNTWDLPAHGFGGVLPSKSYLPFLSLAVFCQRVSVGVDLHWLDHQDQVHLSRIDRRQFPIFLVVGPPVQCL
jgi:hypothetical protein